MTIEKNKQYHMKKNILGIDIGGTKCAVIYGTLEKDTLQIVEKIKFPTTDVSNTLEQIYKKIALIMQKHLLTPNNTSAIGISCGGPLNTKDGIIMSPPNLPGWDNIQIVKHLMDKFKVNTAIENDANACALAEWKFGAGKGYNNIIFITLGTGLGAGLIINGKLYTGANGNAGEIGHIRLSDFGPIGYGKSGSFEGFCSGNGIAQLARTMITEKLQMGEKVSFCKSFEELPTITTQMVAEAASVGNELAINVFAISGMYLGRGLSTLIDILNPEIIILGSIFVRSGNLLEPYMNEAINTEALGFAKSVCKVVPAQLDEHLGDYAALSVAANLIDSMDFAK